MIGDSTQQLLISWQFMSIWQFMKFCMDVSWLSAWLQSTSLTIIASLLSINYSLTKFFIITLMVVVDSGRSKPINSLTWEILHRSSKLASRPLLYPTILGMFAPIDGDTWEGWRVMFSCNGWLYLDYWLIMHLVWHLVFNLAIFFLEEVLLIGCVYIYI